MPNRLDPLGANASDPGVLMSDGRGAERQAFIQPCLACDKLARSKPAASIPGRYRARRARLVRGWPGPPLEAADAACADFAFAI